MLDYAALHALAAVVREGSFERAGAALHLTPSAISQRVRLLEERTGRILVKRGQPCTATPEGEALLRHIETVGQLERSLHDRLPWLREAGEVPGAARLRIGVNADSLASWFVDALAGMSDAGVLFDLVIDDQDHTLELMRKGQVLAAVTSAQQALQGFDSVALGGLRYFATASPAFMAKHFGHGVDAASLERAPALRFNAKDELQSAWMARHVGEPRLPPFHEIASTHGFIDAALAGLGWGVNPAALVAEHLAAGRLVELVPGLDLAVPLYWHCVRKPSPLLALLGAQVRAAAPRHLVTSPAALPPA